MKHLTNDYLSRLIAIESSDSSTPDSYCLSLQPMVRGILDAGWEVLVPEIIDYELRREFIRVNRTKSIRRLDFLNLRLGYLSITTEAMRHAAELWATTRNNGQLQLPTTPLMSISFSLHK